MATTHEPFLKSKFSFKTKEMLFSQQDKDIFNYLHGTFRDPVPSPFALVLPPQRDETTKSTPAPVPGEVDDGPMAVINMRRNWHKKITQASELMELRPDQKQELNRLLDLICSTKTPVILLLRIIV